MNLARRSTTTTGLIGLLALALLPMGPTMSFGERPISGDLRADDSASADPAALARQVGKDQTANLSIVREVAGRPQIDTVEVSGRAHARRVIEEAQDGTGRIDNLLGVEVDTPISALAASGPTNDKHSAMQWSLSKLNASKVWSTSRGQSVSIAVLDSGISRHPDLPGSIVDGGDYTGEGDSRADGTGHGTHVSGVIAAVPNNRIGIAGLAPDARLHAYKVLNSSGRGYTSWAARAIVDATDAGVQIINLSIGGTEYSATLDAAIQYAASKGVLLIAAAGNDAGKGSPTNYPAALPAVIGVGAVDEKGAVGNFSNRGPYVELAAPGVSVISTVGAGGYQMWNGTSMAAPHVAASAALLIAAGVAPSEVRAKLSSTAVTMGGGKNDASGYGLVSPARALGVSTSSVAGPSDSAARVKINVKQTGRGRAVVRWTSAPGASYSVRIKPTSTAWKSMSRNSLPVSGLKLGRSYTVEVKSMATGQASVTTTKRFVVK